MEKSVNGSIPQGVIVMWSGKTEDIPAYWVLCDGNNGTPDLRDRFILGAGHTYLPGNTGGETEITLTVDQMPSHTHDIQDPGHSHITSEMKNSSTDSDDSSLPVYKRTAPGKWTSQEKTGISILPKGGNQPHENRPPYYALCFIMKR